ncbi:phosphatase PAP2 family protein [Halocatena pleomorpha]|uniref:Phosphatase PAP2 family protein n=1 Tax=Halocatena pleomorpha TaxID=1785090 RepID=A0A3P3R7W8_9EURY|nr:phosphatase PAP2 family protein [Halocatena pleomorpha]RRJ29029.1 phosphatase PAP2 family protein [Halocatena pleomorpha]
MARGIGEVGVVNQLPDWSVLLAGIVTQLGDMWFVLVLIGAFYVVTRRDPSLTQYPLRDCSFLLALALGAYALTAVAKYAFGLPRPPGATIAVPPAWIPSIGTPVYESFVTADSFGFPSGHASKSTAVYGGVALVFEQWSTRRRRALGATGVIFAVALSRVVLGVHYVVDVVVGFCLGGVFLWILWTVAGTDPRRSFAVTGVLGVLAVGVSSTTAPLVVVVASLTGIGMWERWGTVRQDYDGALR